MLHLRLLAHLSRLPAVFLFVSTNLAAVAAGCSIRSDADDAVQNEHAVLAADPPVLFDVNDVSVLFPYDEETGTLTPDLPIADFLSQEMFEQVIDAAKTQGMQHSDPIGSAEYESWRVIGFRFDPCAPSPTLASGEVLPDLGTVTNECIVQLRLITQPVSIRGPGSTTSTATGQFPAGKASPQDFAAHLIFDLGTMVGSPNTSELQQAFREYEPIVEGLRRIKALSRMVGADTNGTFLGPHPGLQAAMAAGRTELADEVSEFLRASAPNDKLTLVTFFGVPSFTFAPWIFFRGDVVRDENGVPSFVHRRLPDFASSEVMSQQFPAIQRISTFPEIPDRPLSVARAFEERFAGSPDTDGTFASFDIENPTLAHTENMDCVSCHTTYVFRTSTNGTRGVRALPDISPTRFIAEPGITAQAPSLASVWNVHNFGYLGREWRVSERTLNETAAVVAIMNRILGGDNHVNPGLWCGTDRATLDAIYLCALTQRLDPECFASCTVNGVAFDDAGPSEEKDGGVESSDASDALVPADAPEADASASTDASSP